MGFTQDAFLKITGLDRIIRKEIAIRAQLGGIQTTFLSQDELVGELALVEEALSLTIQKIYEKADLSGLILTGSTTAYTVCRRIGVKRLQLRQRISWGVILTQAPDLSGMAIAVKGGSLGDVDAIQKIVDSVRSRI